MEIYLDSLANDFINLLRQDSIEDYIIYSKTNNLSAKNSAEINCRSNKILYIIWQMDTVSYIKKFSCCYEYDYIETDIEPLIDYMLKNDIYLIENSNPQMYKKEKEKFYNSPFCSRRYRETIYDVYVHFYEQEIYIYTTRKSSPEYNHLISVFEEFLSKNNKFFIIKEKYKMKECFLEQLTKEQEKARIYKSELVKKWLNDSLPISDDSLKQKPRLIQEAYNLYEYLMSKDTFITGQYFPRKIENFWVSGINVGTYQTKGQSFDILELINIKTQYIKDFRPRPFKNYRLLYPNKEINQYVNKDYCKYGHLPISINYHTYMFGVAVPKPSFPQIETIYFSEDFMEAQFLYSTGYASSLCIIIKKGKEWELVKNQIVLHID